MFTLTDSLGKEENPFATSSVALHDEESGLQASNGNVPSAFGAGSSAWGAAGAAWLAAPSFTFPF